MLDFMRGIRLCDAWVVREFQSKFEDLTRVRVFHPGIDESKNTIIDPDP